MDDDHGSNSQLIDLIAMAVGCLEEGDEAGLEAIYRDNPSHAENLRQRLAMLKDIGLLTGEAVPPAAIPDRLGEYRLLRRLGGGGMGVVYLAEQPSLRRQVALKLIRQEHLHFGDARQRFRREVEVIASLQHPGIVPVYEVGEVDGLPYFTMECVDGVSLAELLESLQGQEPASLSGAIVHEQIATLTGAPSAPSRDFQLGASWVEICCRWARELADALGHAHARGVLHRDIKPSNVMVTRSGRVMLLDFGLASTGDSARITRSGAVLGSLPYMAPEQARGHWDNVDERTDVYGLGVTLYELLTLRSPFYDAPQSDQLTLRRVLAGAPPAISARNPSVSWEAETVCRTALDPDPDRRYANGSAMAEDLQAILELRPIAARRPSAGLRLRRWTQRHPTVAVAAVLGFLLLIVTPTLWALREYSARRQITDAHDIQQETLNFLTVDLLQAVQPDEVGKDASMRKVLDAASAKIDGRFPDRPLVEAAIRLAIGTTYRELGILDVAESHFTRALALRRKLLGDEATPTLDVERQLAMVMTSQGRLQEAEDLNRKNLALCRRVLGERHPDTMAFANNLGGMLVRRGSYAEAEQILTDVVQYRLAELGEEHEHTSATMINLARLYTQWGRLAEAEQWIARQLSACRRGLGEDHPHMLLSLGILANICSRQGRFEDSLAQNEELVRIQEQVLGEDNVNTIVSLGNVVVELTRLKRFDEAQSRLDLAQARSRVLGDNHRAVRALKMHRINLLRRRGEVDEALSAIEPLVAEFRATGAPERIVQFAQFLHGSLLQAADRWEDAGLLYQSMLGEQPPPVTNRSIAELYLRSAVCERRAGRLPAAEASLQKADAFFVEHGSKDLMAEGVEKEFVRLYESWEKPELAEAWRERLRARSPR